MNYNDYVKGKEAFKATLIDESLDNTTVIILYNDFLKENSVIDLINESALSEIDDSIFEASSESAKPIAFIIGYIKLKNNVNKYAKAYLSNAMLDIEEAKLKHSDKWDELKKSNPAAAEQKIKAFSIKRTQSAATLNAITDRMDQIAKSSSKLGDIVGPMKAKAKLAAIEKTMKMAKSIYTDNQYAELEDTYDNLKIKAAEYDKKAEEFKKDTTGDSVIKDLVDNGGYTRTAEKPEDSSTYLVIKNSKGEDVYLVKGKEDSGLSNEDKKAIEKIDNDIQTAKDLIEATKKSVRAKKEGTVDAAVAAEEKKIKELEKQKEDILKKNK